MPIDFSRYIGLGVSSPTPKPSFLPRKARTIGTYGYDPTFLGYNRPGSRIKEKIDKAPPEPIWKPILLGSGGSMPIVKDFSFQFSKGKSSLSKGTQRTFDTTLAAGRSNGF